MKKIIWQSRSALVASSFRDRHLVPAANGGNAYDFHAAVSLSSAFDVEVSETAVMRHGESVWSYWRRLHADDPQADALILEPYPIVFGKRHKGIRTVGMIHHIDDHLAASTLKHRWYFRRLRRKLQALDRVVTVSGYWKHYLETLGCRNVKVIYNSFDPEEYRPSQEAKEAFRKKFNIPTDRPVVYIGHASRRKGAYDVYEALKNSSCHMLMSGSQNLAPDLPVQYLHLSRPEYLAMLQVCDVVITFSRMTEGWNRIAHEALLSQTPVIGSGVGGMAELLEGAGQPVVKDPALLSRELERVLREKKTLGEKGHRYAIQFDRNYFTESWTQLMRELLGEN